MTHAWPHHSDPRLQDDATDQLIPRWACMRLGEALDDDTWRPTLRYLAICLDDNPIYPDAAWQDTIDHFTRHPAPLQHGPDIAIPGFLLGYEPSTDDTLEEGLDLVDWDALYSGEHDDEPIIEGIAYRGRWTAIAAPAKAGKSTFTLVAAVAVQAGLDPFDDATHQAVTVLYLDAEMGRVDVHERLDALEVKPGDLARIHYTDIIPRLDTLSGAMQLHETVRRYGVTLVFVDGVNGAVAGAENDDTTWRALYDLTIAPLKRDGVAVVTNDNLGKDKTLGPRGSSVKLDKADAVIQLTRTDDGVKLVTTHRRSASYPLKQSYTIEGVDGAEPIKYRHVAMSWPPGTALAAGLLDELDLPLDVSSRVARQALSQQRDGKPKAEADRWRVGNEALRAAIRYRKKGTRDELL